MLEGNRGTSGEQWCELTNFEDLRQAPVKKTRSSMIAELQWLMVKGNEVYGIDPPKH